MKMKMKPMPMDDMDEDDMEYEAPPSKGSGKKALQAALMERMTKKKHGPRCQCAKCAAKK